jgi:DNA-binding transcriptional LysR family regulator
MIMNVTVKQLRAFLAVAELSSFRRAAGRLRVSQPALSAMIRDMEREVGLRLFDRTTRRVDISLAGREFLPNAAKMVGDLDAALQSLHDIAARVRGHVAVACSPLLASVMLPRIVESHVRKHPGIRISIVDARTDQIVDKVRTGEADLGIGTFREDESGIDRERLMTDKLMLFASRSAAVARKRSARWQDIAAEPLIAMTRESGLRAFVEMGFGSLGRPARPAYEVAQVTSAIALVEVGLGIAVLPAIAWAFARDREVVMRPLLDPQISRDISIIRAAGRASTPAAEGFVRLLRDRVRGASSR